jgi:hypothetical protein
MLFTVDGGDMTLLLKAIGKQAYTGWRCGIYIGVAGAMLPAYTMVG